MLGRFPALAGCHNLGLNKVLLSVQHLLVLPWLFYVTYPHIMLRRESLVVYTSNFRPSLKACAQQFPGWQNL